MILIILWNFTLTITITLVIIINIPQESRWVIRTDWNKKYLQHPFLTKKLNFKMIKKNIGKIYLHIMTA
jgi:hypothetical protein